MVARSLVAFVAIIILVLFQETCTAKHLASCPPSSCGKIRNISYPFRLKGDPHHCGLPRYEFDCVNNVTVFSLFSGKYHVQEVNYTRYQIRLSDAGVVEDTASACSSIPRYFLSRDNFSFFSINNRAEYFVSDPLTLWQGEWSFPLAVLFIKCANPVTDDPRYVDVDTTHCNKGERGHIYVVLSDLYPLDRKFAVIDIKVGCQMMVATYANGELSRRDNRNVSYADIQKRLVHGFWLSWFLPVTCKDICGKGVTCSINETTAQVQCQKRYYHYVYHITDKDKRGISDQVIGDTRGYLKRIVIGILSRITFSAKQLCHPVGFQYFDEAVFIGRNVISFVVAARYILGVAIFIVLFIYKWRRRHLSFTDADVGEAATTGGIYTTVMEDNQ